MKPNSDVIPVVWPHDGNKITGQGESTKDQYLKDGGYTIMNYFE